MTSDSDGSGVAGGAATLAGLWAYVAFGHLWPAVLAAALGAAIGATLFWLARWIVRHLGKLLAVVTALGGVVLLAWLAGVVPHLR